MEKTQKDLKFKILSCYWSCYYFYDDNFDGIMANHCIEILLLEDKFGCDFQTSALNLHRLYEQDLRVSEEEIMERDSVLAAIAWWYFNKEELDLLVASL